MLTPNDIEVLLHCHVSPEPHPRLDAPAVQESIKMWICAGMIEPNVNTGIFVTTDKGCAMVMALCKTPYPRLIYIDQNGEEL